MNAAIHSQFRDPKSVQRLSQTFAQSLSALDLAEPLFSLDENQPMSLARDLMRKRNVTVLGVRRDGLVEAWIGTEDQDGTTIGESSRAFLPDSVLEVDASLETILSRFPQAGHLFVRSLGEVAGVISPRDLQKPAIRMWLFGAVTILDTNLTWAIHEMFPEDSWRPLISPGRVEKAASLHAERLRRGTECSLADCLQIKDKTDILVHDKEHLAALGFPSRNESERMTRAIEKLRNHLAHAQELDERDLETAARLASLIRVIVSAEGAQRLVALQREKTARTSLHHHDLRSF
jgi:hypothetical protein